MAEPTEEPQVEKRHALLWAIAEFRDDLDRLFDEHKALVLGRSAEATPAAPAAPPVKAEPFPTAADPAPAEPPPPAPRPAATPRTRATAAAAPAAAPTPTTAADATPRPAREDDPRQRLDALAKLLDRRLKQPAGETTSKDGEG